MEIRKSKEGEIVVIEPEGRIDATSAHDFEEAVVGELTEGTRRFVIDFGSVEYISSAGLRVLLMLGKKLGGKDEKLVLCSLNDSVKEVFGIAGFTAVYNIVLTRPEAMKGFTVSSGPPQASKTPETSDRVSQALRLLRAKPQAASKKPLSKAARLGRELLTES